MSPAFEARWNASLLSAFATWKAHLENSARILFLRLLLLIRLSTAPPRITFFKTVSALGLDCRRVASTAAIFILASESERVSLSFEWTFSNYRVTLILTYNGCCSEVASDNSSTFVVCEDLPLGHHLPHNQVMAPLDLVLFIWRENSLCPSAL